ncbi:helix-turn-helix transcriptional regulator [Devosia sp. LjRoot16]|uniref:helix-turn-helix transcriptional regulator n=1 Tax=Devosia sp. LjRoot16 TaxID=3342271 RepID=UPI003ECCF7ED
MLSDDADRRKCLANLLTAARHALPAPRGGRRRTPGWRREEVADTAGMSVTWYTWLEQGRDVTASDDALRRLSRALRLDATQSRYLFELARPGQGPAPTVDIDEPELQPFLDGLLPLPAYALDRGWTIIASNAAARRVLLLRDKTENLIEKLFLDPSWRTLFADWETLAASMVGQYRAAIGARPEYGPEVKRLIAQSEAFAALWAAGAVRPSPLWLKPLDHPELGRLVMRYAALRLGGRTDLTISIYTPADAATEAMLRRSSDT